MRGWTEAENVKAKRFPGMERVKKERERAGGRVGWVEFKAMERYADPEEWGTLEKNREWRDGLNVSDIQPTL